MADIISDYGIGPSEDYAHRVQQQEEFQKSYKVTPGGEKRIADSVALQANIQKIGATDSLFGNNVKITWSTFATPPGYLTRRSSSSYILGALDDVLPTTQKKIELTVSQHENDPAIINEGASINSTIVFANSNNALVKVIDGKVLEFLKG